ncbi:MAG: YbhB/YbcL family Raf kinase inhibitor-like protein [Actinomycetaceae bacterium]|nr:YbhB/YbcL family Raf kinase inhibitor-like protein [Actinomycetaceae bacterium]
MDFSTRPRAPHPDAALPVPATFTLTSNTAKDGDPLPQALTAAGGSNSPHLAWSGFPAETQSFMVTCFDPDAPTPAGFWHWMIVDLPASQTELPAGAGVSDLELDGPAFHLCNDAGEAGYFGAAPPAGDRAHRYVFSVYALDTDSLQVDDETSATRAFFTSLQHVLARASLTLEYAEPAS